MEKKNKIIVLIPAAIGLLLAIGVMTVFSACGIKDDGTWMHCHDSQNAIAACGIGMTVIFALAAFVKNKALTVVLDAAALATAVTAFMLPGIIMPMCMMRTMRCYTVMQPFVRIMAVCAAICAVWGIVSALKHKG